jgi:hypothetical protein
MIDIDIVLGPLFGVLTRAMNRKSIRKFLQLPQGVSVIESLMAVEGDCHQCVTQKSPQHHIITSSQHLGTRIC